MEYSICGERSDLSNGCDSSGILLWHEPVMSLLIRYAHIPFYFRFSFTFPTLPIHPYAPPLRRDRTRARTTIALALLDRSRLFDGHMTYDSHVFTSILSVSNVPPPAVRPITTLICLGCNKDLRSQRSKYKSYGALRGCNLGVRDCLQVYCGK